MMSSTGDTGSTTRECGTRARTVRGLCLRRPRSANIADAMIGPAIELPLDQFDNDEVDKSQRGQQTIVVRPW